MLDMVLVAVSWQAVTPHVSLGFPGCPPEAVSSLCAPPPPPPPRRWDDHTLETVWRNASRDFLRLSSTITPERFQLSESDWAKAAAPIGSPEWETRRRRIIAVLAVERQIWGIRQRLIPYANDHRATASAGDIAEFDSLDDQIYQRRRTLAATYERLLEDLIDRPSTRQRPIPQDRPPTDRQ